MRDAIIACRAIQPQLGARLGSVTMHFRPKVIEETEVILESAASATVEDLLGFIFSKVNSKKTGGSDEERRQSALLSTQPEQSKRLDLLDSMIRQHAAATAEAP